MRVLPTALFAAVTYPMMGLRPGLWHYGRFLGVLVLTNLAGTAMSMAIGAPTPPPPIPPPYNPHPHARAPACTGRSNRPKPEISAKSPRTRWLLCTADEVCTAFSEASLAPCRNKPSVRLLWASRLLCR